MFKRITLLTLAWVLLLTSVVQAQPDRLDAWYRGYNEKYFNNELPKEITITHDLRDNRFQAWTQRLGDSFHVAFNPLYNLASGTERLTLLHELCHIRNFVESETEFDDHGPKWQSCMHDLAHKGAFDELW